MEIALPVNRLETHDRYLEVMKQSQSIAEYCQKLINDRPFGDNAFYMFAHKRTVGWDEKLSCLARGNTPPSDRLLWQCRLTKPTPQFNSMLFKGFPGTDIVKVLWVLPEEDTADQFLKGLMTESEIINDSLRRYWFDRKAMSEPEPEDLSDEKIASIYKERNGGRNSV